MGKISTVGSMHVDTRELKGFAKVIRREAPEVGKRLRRSLKAAGEIVAADARPRAAAAMANPPKIAVRNNAWRSFSVSVVATGPAITGLLETGNKGTNGGGTFRHPVFGNTDVWVDQPMHPYLEPALASKGQEAVEAIAVALDETVAAIAFEHEVAF